MADMNVYNPGVTPVVIGAKGQVLGGHESMPWDPTSLPPAQYILIQTQINRGLLVVRLGAVNVPAPATSGLTDVAINGSELTFTTLTGDTKTVTLPATSGGGSTGLDTTAGDARYVKQTDIDQVDVLTTTDLDPYQLKGDTAAAAVAAVGGKFWSGTQAAYDALPQKDAATFYFIEG